MSAHKNEHSEPSANQYFDRIHEAQEKIFPVLQLMSLSSELNPRLGGALTNEELSGIGLLLRDLYEDVFKAVDNLEELCKEQKCG
ncbi:MAG: hypothetical protein OEV59_04530 [Deltaproteobacteria bacterium]|nr:hypothetical protein [Deltaproteobacteria bacterium]